MSGSSLDGLDIAYVHLQVSAGKWEYNFVHTACYSYSESWKERLASAQGLSAIEYQLLHTEYGHYMGQQVNRFIEEFRLHYQVQLIASHGHTSFHLPGRKMTAQLGDGAALAAETGINVVSDLRAMDVALGGQGAPIVPVGERLLWHGYALFLNLGGIANITGHGMEDADAGGAGAATAGGAVAGEMSAGGAGAAVGGIGEGGAAGFGAVADGSGAQVTEGVGGKGGGAFVAFDVCPANRVLNSLAAPAGRPYDEGGALAAGGKTDAALLQRLNGLDYYAAGYPKSLANEFGTGVVYPLIEKAGLPVADALRTYVEHIGVQIARAVGTLGKGSARAAEALGKGGARGLGEADAGTSEVAERDVPGMGNTGVASRKMLVTGGGAHNAFLVGRIREMLAPLGVEVIVPDKELIDYKEALVMALIGVLRWREENNTLASVTGASRDSIGGAVWIGQEG